MHSLISFLIIVTLVGFGRAATPGVSLRISLMDGSPKGFVIEDMISIFSVAPEDAQQCSFKILKQKLEVGPPSAVISTNIVSIGNNSGILKLTRQLDREDLCRNALNCVLKLQLYFAENYNLSVFLGNTDEWATTPSCFPKQIEQFTGLFEPIRAAVMLPQRVFSLLNLDVVISDVNDNAPVFPIKPIILNVSEDLQRGDVINLDRFQARDSDSGNNSIISYSISSNHFFSIHSFLDNAGIPHLNLLLLHELDYEVQTKLSMVLVATDNGKPPQSSHVTILIQVIDYNDNAPVFEINNYVTSLLENTPPGTAIVKVKALDLDNGDNGRVTYNILESNTGGPDAIQYLSINASTGVISLKKHLDRETYASLSVEIEAKDRGIPALSSKARFLVRVDDVNDNLPVTSIKFIATSFNNTAYISESSPIGTLIAYVKASDADYEKNGDVTIAATTSNPGNEDEDFILTSEGFIKTAKEFDRESTNRYDVTISACDNGVSPRCQYSNIIIEILDENDNSPMFERDVYDVTMLEGEKIGTLVMKVTATDDDNLNQPIHTQQNDEIVMSTNGDICYSIIGGEGILKMDKKLGRIILIGSLDREEEERMNVILVAEDGGEFPENGTAILKIHVVDTNDNSPIFIVPAVNNSNLMTSIRHNGIITKIQAIDYDAGENSDVTIQLISVDGFRDGAYRKGENPFTYFLFDSSNLLLNFEDHSPDSLLGTHYLIFEARDRGKPLQVTRLGVNVHVTEDGLTLVTERTNDFSSKSSAFPYNVIITVSIAVFLLLLIFCVIKIWHNTKKLQTYNCREAEEKNGCGLLRRLSRHDEIVETARSDNTDVTIRDATSCVKPSLSFNQQRRSSSLSISHPLSTHAQSKLNFIDFSGSFKARALSVASSLPPNITPESPFKPYSKPLFRKVIEGSQFGQRNDVKFAIYNQNQGKLPVWRFQSEREFHHRDVIKDSNLENFCTDDCLIHGHSDSCWMPGNASLQTPAPPRTNNDTERVSSSMSERHESDLGSITRRKQARNSLCLALLSSQSRVQDSDDSGDEDSSIFKLFEDDDSPLSSVFASNASSPAPPSDHYQNKLTGYDPNKPSNDPVDLIVQTENYLSIKINEFRS